jgi:hypothetical protein
MSLSNETGHRRRFGLGDAMILIAAIAAALSWLRKPLEYRLTFISDGRIIDNLRPSTLVGAAFAATLGLGVLAIRLRPPRPCGREWKHRPGFVACVAATAGCLAKLVALLVWGASENYRFESWYVPSILGQLIEPAAMAVAGGWLTLWLAGMWRRERTWIDNLGIIVGLSWFALEVFAWAALCLE